MVTVYAGPLRDEPIAIELHNTVYAAGGAVVDGLADPASVEGLARRSRAAPARRRRPLRTMADRPRARRAQGCGARRPARGRGRSGAGRGRARRDQPRQRARSTLADRRVATRCRPRRGNRLPRRQPSRRRHRRTGSGRDRPAHRSPTRRSPGLRCPGLRPDVPQGPPAPRVVLQHLRQPRPPGQALSPRADGRTNRSRATGPARPEQHVPPPRWPSGHAMAAGPA